MIANKPVRFCISLIHLSIALFCLAFCVGFTLTDKDGSLHNLISSGDFFPLLICFIISLSAFASFVIWQGENFLLSKTINYLTVFLGVLEYITILIIEADELIKIITISMFFIAPLVFIFLLGFSKVGAIFSFQTNKIETLDAFFLEEDKKLKEVYFWKINRIVGIAFFIFCVFVALGLLDDAPIVLFLPTLIFLLTGSLWLLIFPKVGSYIFAILCILVGVGIFSSILFSIIVEKSPSNFDDIIFATTTIFCTSFFFFAVAMLLLSKEAKEEWKK